MLDKSNKPLLPLSNGSYPPMLSLNYRYCLSLPGILKLIEMMLNVACINLMLQYCNPTYTAVTWGFLGNTDETLFILINFSALMMNALFFISCILSVATAVALSKSVLDVMGNIAHFFICIGSSLVLLSSVVTHQPTTKYKEYIFQGKVTVSVLGIVNSLLYLCSVLAAYWTCKSSRY